MPTAFQKEKDKILSDLPANVKSMFGQIGFAAPYEEDDFIPVLILSPFQVPPKPFRNVYWNEKYSRSKRAKNLKELDYLVYHYGSSDMNDCYSFVEQAEFQSYETGVEKGYNIVPAAIQAKIDAKLPLDEDETDRVRAIEEMTEDMAKPVAERNRGQTEFKEQDDDESEDDEPVKKKAKSKK